MKRVGDLVPKITAAVFEVSRQLLTTVGPSVATQALLRIASDRKHRHHLKAAELIANRVGLHETREVVVKHAEESLEAKIEQVRLLARILRIDPEPLLGG